MQQQNEILCQDLHLKTSELNERIHSQESLNEQISTLKAQIESEISEEKERIKSLSDELSSKNALLQEYGGSSNEKDAKISVLIEDKNVQALRLAEMQQQNELLCQDLHLKTSELNERLHSQESLNEQISTLKAQIESEISEEKEKVLRLVNEAEILTSSLQDKEELLSRNKVEISNFTKQNDDLRKMNSALEDKVHELEKSLMLSREENADSVRKFQQEIQKLEAEKNNALERQDEKMQDLNTSLSDVTEELKANNTLLSDKDSKISLLSNKIEEQTNKLCSLEKDLDHVKAQSKMLANEKAAMNENIKTKEELLTSLQTKLDDVTTSVTQKNSEIIQKEKELVSVQDALKLKEQENLELVSNLQHAEQKVEMLNKDSSEHVLTLQNELSKLKDESFKTETSLKQKAAELVKEKEDVCKNLSDKCNLLQEKMNILSKLEADLKVKEEKESILSNEIEKLKTEVRMGVKENEELKKSYTEQLQVQQENSNSLLKEKDKHIVEITEGSKKLELDLKMLTEEKEKCILDSNQLLQAKEEEISNLQNEMAKIKHTLDTELKRSSDLEDSSKKELVEKSDLESQLFKLTKLMEESSIKASEREAGIERYEKDLQSSISECHALRKTVNEKEAQFDDLSQLIQASELQLIQLADQNTSNLALLQSKETFFSDFKAEKEQQLLELEKKSRNDINALENAVSDYKTSITEKDNLISKLNAEAEEQNTQLKQLQSELIIAKERETKVLNDTQISHKDLVQTISDMETKYSRLLEEKNKFEEKEHKAKGTQQNLEAVRDNLIQEKVQQEEVVKDKEKQLAILQAEVNRMQSEFSLHKHELLQKLDVSAMELEAAHELKIQLELQHSVTEELQQELHSSEEMNENLKMQLQDLTMLSSEKSVLLKRLSSLEEAEKEKDKKMEQLSVEHQALQEKCRNVQNMLDEKHLECTSLNEKLQIFTSQEEANTQMKSSLKSLEKENSSLKQKVETSNIEKSANEKGACNINQMDSDERESLLSQIDFLNSIIVDMKQKNEKLQHEIEIFQMGPEEVDTNFNDVAKKLAPRLFCDICDMFDLHDTDDCPKQASYLEDEGVPQLIPQGVRKIEERPYCNNCEIFGHWTLDCDIPETY